MIKVEHVFGNEVKMQVWDTAGQERFRSITNSYYRGAHCVIVTVDLTDAESLTHLDAYLDAAERYCSETCFVVLCGTKAMGDREVKRDVLFVFLCVWLMVG